MDELRIQALIARYDGLGAAYQPHVQGYLFFVLQNFETAINVAESFKEKDFSKRCSARPKYLRLVSRK